MQSVCSDKGVKLPWDDIGATMEEHVSGGAIIQHISKLRQRLEAMGKNVPPPPRRGGGYGNSSSKGRNVGFDTPATRTPTAPKRMRASANVSSKIMGSDTGEEEIDVDGASDSEEEFGSRKSKADKADIWGVKQEDQNTAGNAGEKRKRDGGCDSPLKRSKKPTGRKLRKGKNRRANDRTSSSASSGQDTGSREKSPGSDDDRYQQESIGRQFLAVGADFFQDYDQDDASTPHASGSGESDVANRVVVLRLGESERTKAFLQRMQSQERVTRGTYANSVPSSRATSIARFDGGRESTVRVAEVSSKIADVDYRSMTLENPSQLSQEYAQRLQQAPLSHASGSFVVNSNYSTIGLDNDSLLGGDDAIYNPPIVPNQNFQASGDWDFQSMPADLVSMNFAAPVEYSAHLNQEANLGGFASSNIYSDSFNYRPRHANSFETGSSWRAPLAFDHGSAIAPSSSNVPPAALSGRITGIGRVVYENSSSRSQVSLDRYTQQVQGSAVINSASSAETPVSTFAASNSLLSDNTGAIQVPDIEISEDMNWAEYLEDLPEVEDIFNTSLMTNIPGEHNGSTGVED